MLLMIMIFYFSSQEASASTETSTSLGRGIILVKASILGEELSTDEIERQALLIDHVVRKTAHATEYMMLGMFVSLGMAKSAIYSLGGGDIEAEKLEKPNKTAGYKKLKLYLISLAIAVLYASSDEFHQYFVPGRSAQITDVMIDSAGALAGVVIYYLASLKIKFLDCDL